MEFKMSDFHPGMKLLIKGNLPYLGIREEIVEIVYIDRNVNVMLVRVEGTPPFVISLDYIVEIVRSPEKDNPNSTFKHAGG